jgi:hypothetical protein
VGSIFRRLCVFHDKSCKRLSETRTSILSIAGSWILATLRSVAQWCCGVGVEKGLRGMYILNSKCRSEQMNWKIRRERKRVEKRERSLQQVRSWTTWNIMKSKKLSLCIYRVTSGALATEDAANRYHRCILAELGHEASATL